MTSLLLALGIAAVVYPGDVRVTCEPGLTIFVDGELAGVSDAKELGAYITDLDRGEHTFRVAKDGFTPREFEVVVGSEPRQVVVGELSPIPADGAAGGTEQVQAEQRGGTLEIITDPAECTVEVADQRIVKQEMFLIVLDVPEGDHTLWLQKLAVLLSAKVAVTPGATVRVTADFDSKKILTSVHTPDPANEEKEAKKGKDGCYLYWIEIIRTSDAEKVETTKETLEEMGFSVYHMQLRIVDDDGVIPMYKLFVGPFRNHHSASRTRFQITKKDFKSSRVIREACP